MRIVLPVSAFDQHLAPKWCEVIQYLECGRNHELHLVFPRSAEVAANAIYERLRNNFDEVKLHMMESEPIGGWPFGPNTQFFACAQFMLKDNPRLPWFLCELDCYPIRSNSFDILASRYTSAGSPFYGKVSPTFWRDDNGRISSSLFGKDDTTMSGCAVYPGDLIRRRFTAPLMADLMKGFDESTGAPTVGWDAHLRYAIRREGVSDCGNLIADNWNTINYRVDGNKIVCENNPDHEIYKRNPNFEIRSTNTPIGFDVLVIHGCKDGSLPDLILNNKLPLEAISPKQTVTTKVVKEEDGILKNELEEMRKMMAQQQQLIASLLQQKVSETTTTQVNPIIPLKEDVFSANSTEVIEVESAPEAPTSSNTELTQEALIKHMKEAGKALTCKNVAVHFGVPFEEMALFVAKTPGLKLSGPPVNWITLAE